MKAAKRYMLVLVTAPDLKVARKLIALILKARVAACGNLMTRLESHYWWQGKLEKSSEVLILFKTTKPALPRLEELVLANHPYDTPEIVALSLSAGTARYLDWISSSVTPGQLRSPA
jgi:periplasmic divalent cation tolerance protein